MADTTYQSAGMAHNPFTRIANAVLNFLIAVSETSAISRRLQAVSEMSDAELKAKGTTREDAVRKVLSDMQYI